MSRQKPMTVEKRIKALRMVIRRAEAAENRAWKRSMIKVILSLCAHEAAHVVIAKAVDALVIEARVLETHRIRWSRGTSGSTLIRYPPEVEDRATIDVAGVAGEVLLFGRNRVGMSTVDRRAVLEHCRAWQRRESRRGIRRPVDHYFRRAQRRAVRILRDRDHFNEFMRVFARLAEKRRYP